MIPIFVISLQDCSRRRANISKYLDELSLPFEFIDAIDGRQGLSDEHQDKINRNIKDGALSDVEYACALSHMKTYKKIVEDCIPYALILEDDAIPQPDLPDYLATRHYESLQMISLGYSPTYVHPSNSEDIFKGFTAYQCMPSVRVVSAVGYIISFAAAKHILNNALPVNSVADWPKCTELFKSNQSWRLIHPRLVKHTWKDNNGEPSIIGPMRSSRVGQKKKRRFLGFYIPPWKRMVDSYYWRLTYRVRGYNRIW